ncbi:MAG: aminotransferase class I/II-fold pyridoxal phosphate-dependent enzyme [Anaerolineaceae bacterium]|nr:aminotransferase class I/II-fold pyridoxal phosphate-dependent enzyme [Anaerolineaceae bacterium]
MLTANSRIFLSPPHMSGWEEQYIKEAFLSNWIAPIGPNVDAFEKEVAQYVGAKGAVALCSGTAAIHLALKLVNVGQGDVVFCSSLTFAATANPILYQGAIPVFIDSQPTSWNMSPEALSCAFSEAERAGKLPKAVITVNLYGQSSDMDPILDVCNAHNVPLIEDAAESLGATYKGKASGTIGKYGIYSFNGNKIITTSGGGMLVSDDIAGLEKVRFWATQARDPAKHYQHSRVGYNYRMSNVLAGIGRGQLRVLDERVRTRRAIFERYYKALSTIPGVSLMPEAGFGLSTHWLTSLTIEKRLCRVSASQVIDALAEENIEARPVWKPLHLQPLFRRCQYYTHGQESVSDQLFESGICLPSGSSLSEGDQERVIQVVKRCLLERVKAVV